MPPNNSVYVWADSVYVQIFGLFSSEEEFLTKTDSGDICERLSYFFLTSSL